MFRKYLVVIIVGILLGGLIAILSNSFRDGRASVLASAEDVIKEVKNEAECGCGCGFTLEDCEKYDPSCPIRPGIISEVEQLANQGKEKDEIIGTLNRENSISQDDDPVKGSESAPVTIIEFSDYQCPFCARFYLETLSKIEEEYIDTGKVKFIYRDFPLGFHDYAQKSAEASECADEQGKFWEYHDILFSNQSEWSNQGIPKLKEYADRLSLDQNKFDACLDNGDMASEVQKDFSDGKAYGVTGTPAFFINGELVSGALPFEAFKQKIEEALK